MEVLRATLESGTLPEIERRIRSARVLVSSRLSLVESCRVVIRLRALGVAEEDRLADAGRDIAGIWARCELGEITRRVCEMACEVARGRRVACLGRDPPRQLSSLRGANSRDWSY
jgi:hypothetical protein